MSHSARAAIPRVAVIIVNWNGGELLAQCLDHLSSQTVTPAQILVLDNASTDNSADSALAYADVRLIRSALNLGFAAGNNLALAHCDCELVALLNADAFAQPDWLERLIVAAMANPDVAAFGSLQLSCRDPAIIDGLGDRYHVSGLARRIGYGEPLTNYQSNCDKACTREVFSVCAAAALYRRDALLRIGGFDEDFFCYFEDIDLGFRLRLAGFGAVTVNGAIVHHLGSASSGGYESEFSVYHGHRNMVWAFVKNMPAPLLLPLLPLHLLANMLTVLMFSLRGRAKLILRAKWDALLGLPKAWRKRRVIQQNRVADTGSILRALSLLWRDSP